MIFKRYKNYKNFGKCLELTNGSVKALITVDVGPRIIFYGYKGFNFMYEDKDSNVSKGGEFFDENFGPGEKWYIYGGHRLWKSPEDMASYVPDNYPVKVVKTERGAEFFPRPQKLTGIQAGIKVEMEEDGGLNICHTFKNVGEEMLKVSLWALTVLRQGGVEIVPLNSEDTGFLPSKNIVIWPYNDLKDRRFTLSHKYMVLRQNKRIERPFKVGTKSIHGMAAYSCGGNLLVKKFDVDEGVLQDMGCNFETYTNQFIMEMEGLSAEREILPGEMAAYNESLCIFQDVKFKDFSDNEIDYVFRGLGLLNG